MSRIRFPLLAMLALVLALAACQKIKTKLGIGDTITDPAPGTPEKVVQDVLRAARNGDEEAGWEQFQKLLHPEEVELQSSLSNWRQFKYRGIRKKVNLLVQDPATMTFKVMDRREEGASLVVMVENSGSDMPTPCRLKTDAKGQWKVFNSCF
jgi:hypothetical protein